MTDGNFADPWGLSEAEETTSDGATSSDDQDSQEQPARDPERAARAQKALSSLSAAPRHRPVPPPPPVPSGASQPPNEIVELPEEIANDDLSKASAPEVVDDEDPLNAALESVTEVADALTHSDALRDEGALPEELEAPSSDSEEPQTADPQAEIAVAIEPQEEISERSAPYSRVLNAAASMFGSSQQPQIAEQTEPVPDEALPEAIEETVAIEETKAHLGDIPDEPPGWLESDNVDDPFGTSEAEPIAFEAGPDAEATPVADEQPGNPMNAIEAGPASVEAEPHADVTPSAGEPHEDPFAVAEPYAEATPFADEGSDETSAADQSAAIQAMTGSDLIGEQSPTVYGELSELSEPEPDLSATGGFNLGISFGGAEAETFPDDADVPSGPADPFTAALAAVQAEPAEPEDPINPEEAKAEPAESEDPMVDEDPINPDVAADHSELEVMVDPVVEDDPTIAEPDVAGIAEEVATEPEPAESSTMTSRSGVEWGTRWSEAAQGWVEDAHGRSTWRPIVSTSPTLSDWDVDTYLGVVNGDASVPSDDDPERAVGVARERARGSMLDEALARGAHGVIGVAFAIQPLGSSTLVSASGTAVTLKARV